MKNNNHCFKCGGKLEMVEDCTKGMDGEMTDISYLKCVKCGQPNNWYEKEQWEKKNA